MSVVVNTEPRGAAADKKPKGNEKKELKILMLHGYTQSGPLFHSKTRALEKILIKALAPMSTIPVLIFPTAPNHLSAKDIPGFTPGGIPDVDFVEEEEIDAWAWWRKDDASGAYRFFGEGTSAIATSIREAGGVDGVIGFSQGGAAAALVAAMLDQPHRTAPEEYPWLKELRDANSGRRLLFAVSYSGFFAPDKALKWCYEPKIRTPILHYIGSLDTVVDESRSQALVDHCEESLVAVHPGGHYVPISKEWIMPLVGFIRKYSEEADKTSIPSL